MTTRPTELPATPCSIFELVDATNDETYYTLGLYLTLQDAVDDACVGDSPPTDCYEDFATLEVRERKLGYSGHSNNGKKVAVVVWTRDFESDEDGPWRFECKSNAGVPHGAESAR
jgi:hypothetical protein